MDIFKILAGPGLDDLEVIETLNKYGWGMAQQGHWLHHLLSLLPPKQDKPPLPLPQKTVPSLTMVSLEEEIDKLDFTMNRQPTQEEKDELEDMIKDL